MIAKHIAIRPGRQSSFSGLVKYLTNEKGLVERVNLVNIVNCQSQEVTWAVQEVLHTQAQNTRAQSDKTYHLLMSFPSNELPTVEALRDMEHELCIGLGYGEHQRISVIHNDTDSLHMHVAINKIHPKRFTIHEPYRDYGTLGEVCTQLEIKHDLQRVDHTPRQHVSQNKVNDMERMIGIESFLSWVQHHCRVPLQQAKTWNELHQVLQENGLEISLRGYGMIVTDHSGMHIKASSIARDLSKEKLEARLGAFEPPPVMKVTQKIVSKHPRVAKVGTSPPTYRKNRLQTLSQVGQMVVERGKRYEPRPLVNSHALYAQYQAEQHSMKELKPMALLKIRHQKAQQIEAVKRMAHLKRATIKFMGGKSQRMLYAMTSQTVHKEIEKINQQYLKDRHQIYGQYHRRAWNDWLKHQARKGDLEALSVLRMREVRSSLQGNLILGQDVPKPYPVPPMILNNVTQHGTLIYKAGVSAVRDDGKRLKVSEGAAKEAVELALRMAMQRYGSKITVKGTEVFKTQVAQVAANKKLNLTFDDPALESRRQFYCVQKKYAQQRTHQNNHYAQEQSHERIRTRDSLVDARSTHPDRGITLSHVSGTHTPHQSDVRSIGSSPPPQSQNRLRNLSQLGMVHFADRSEVLLSGDVSRDMEYQRTQPDQRVRWDVSGSAGITLGERAVDKYIVEREEKRLRGLDVPKHVRYCHGDERKGIYQGTRQVDGQFLALIQRNEEMVVMPIHEVTAHRLKRVKIGEAVKITLNGALIRARSQHR